MGHEGFVKMTDDLSYPSGIWATQMLSALGFAWISDHLLGGRRWPPLLFVAVSGDAIPVRFAGARSSRGSKG